MVIRFILFFLSVTSFAFAQSQNKTLVFRVRARETSCDIECEQNYFLLERDNPVKIKITATHNIKTKVEVTEGKIISVKDDIYYIRCLKTGTAAISVYQITPKGKELLAAKKMKIKNPDVFFCDIKLDSTSKYIRLNGNNIYAYSNYYKQKMEVASFEMYFIEDTTKKSNKRVPPICMESQVNQLTDRMKKTILDFQPKYNSIYLTNIICKVPDGTKRFLDPIQLDISVDTANKERLSLVYSIKRKEL